MKNTTEKVASGRDFFGRSGKMGLYTVAVSVILLAALIVVNLICGSLPSGVMKLDTSPNKLYSLSQTSVDFLSGLDEEVTLWYVCREGSSNKQVETFLERYAAASPKLKLEKVDPVKKPDFLKKYAAEEASNYSIIVESEKRFRTVDFGNLVYYYNENIGQLTPDEYQSFQSYYGQYASMYPFTEYFDGDNQITGAVEYVTADKVPTVYLTEGHEEAEPDAVVTSNLFTYGAIETHTLNIALPESEIPEDADVIIINNPLKDLSDGEAEKLIAFFDKGGKIILITAPGCDLYTNLAKLTSHFGMTAGSGTVSEGESSHAYPRNAQYIYPEVSSTASATSLYGQYESQSSSIGLIIPFSHPIILSDVEGITNEALLSTTEKGYTGSDDTGVFTLAAAAYSGDGKFAWIASAQSVTSTFISATNGGNFYFLYSVFSWMQNRYSSSLPTIAAIDMSLPTLTVSEEAANFVGTVLIVVIPGAVLAGGLIYWLWRRKR